MSNSATDSASTEVDSGRTAEGSSVPNDAIDGSTGLDRLGELANMNRSEAKPEPKEIEQVVDTAEDLSDQMKIVNGQDKVCLYCSSL